MNERTQMDWENVINWEALGALTPEQVNAILDMFEGKDK